MDKAIKSVEDNLKSTQRSLKDVNRLLKLDPGNFELLKQKNKLLASSISDTSEKLKILKEADKQAKQQLEAGNLGKDKYDALQREIFETEQSLKKLQKESASASAIFEKISVASGNFGEKAKAVGQKLLPVTGAVAGMGTASVVAANNFEDAMSQAAGALDKPMAQMEELRQLAIKTGQDTMFSAKEAGEAITELAKGGLTEADVKGGALKATMDLAASSGMDLATAANTVVQTMGAFGLSADQTSEAVNALAGAAAASSTDVVPLTDGLAQVAAQAFNAGWSVQETTAVLGRFADAGIVGSDAGTSLKTMLQRIAAPTDTAAELMELLNINVRDSNGHMLSASAVAEELQTKLGGLSEAERDAALQAIFGSDASRAASIMMRSGAEELDRYIKATSDQEAAQRLANSQMGSGTRAIEELKGSLETAAIAIGDTIAPIIEKVAKFITELVNRFTNLPKGVQTGIIAFVAFMGILGPFLIIVGQIAMGISALTAIIGAASTPILPIIAIIAAVIAAIIAVIAVIKNWGAISEWFGNLCEKINEKIKNAWNKMKTAVVESAKKMKDDAVDAFWKMVNGIAEKVANIKDIVKSGFQKAIDFITELPEKAVGWGRDFIDGLKQGIRDRIESVVECVRGVADKIRSFLHFSRPDEGPLRDYETWMPDMMKGLARGIYKNMPLIENAVNAVARTMNMDMNPQFDYSPNQAVNVNNAVTVMIGNEQLKGYVVKTATKGINDMNRRNLSVRGGR